MSKCARNKRLTNVSGYTSSTIPELTTTTKATTVHSHYTVQLSQVTAHISPEVVRHGRRSAQKALNPHTLANQ